MSDGCTWHFQPFSCHLFHFCIAQFIFGTTRQRTSTRFALTPSLPTAFPKKSMPFVISLHPCLTCAIRVPVESQLITSSHRTSVKARRESLKLASVLILYEDIFGGLELLLSRTTYSDRVCHKFGIVCFLKC